MVAQADLPPVKPGQFYYFQLLGMEVRLAKRDVAWLLDQRAGRDAHITEWEAWLRWNQPSTSHQRGDDPYEKA
jgi:hypothetical protein